MRKFDYKKLKVGDKLHSRYHKRDVIINNIIPYNIDVHGDHTDPDGSMPSHIIQTDEGWFSANTGLYGAIRGLKEGTIHLEMKQRKLFHAVVRAESETLELPNLFNDEEEAKEYAKKYNFEYVCKGNEVYVPE